MQNHRNNFFYGFANLNKYLILVDYFFAGG